MYSQVCQRKQEEEEEEKLVNLQIALKFPTTTISLSHCCHRTFLISEKTLEKHNLADADDKQQDGFADRPVGNTLMQVLCPGAVVCLPQPVPHLGFSHNLQDLMNSDTRGLQLKNNIKKIDKYKYLDIRLLYCISSCIFHTYLSQRCDSTHGREERFFITHMEIQVNRFVRESGEFVAKADFVNSLHGCGMGEAVVLLLLLMIQDLVFRICDKTVDVIVSTGEYLKETKQTEQKLQ